MDFLTNVKNKAKSNLKTIVLPETTDERTLVAAEQILKEGIANIILIGDKKALESSNFNLEGATIVDTTNYEKMEELSTKLFEMRKNKGMTIEEAKRLLAEDSLYLGVMLVKEGIADGMVAGALNSTANVMRPSLQILKTAPNTKLVSSFFIMVVPDCEYGNKGVFIFSDCGLNQNPNAEELAAIAISSATSYEKLVGSEAVVAMLSHSTKGSAKHADVDKVSEATKIAKGLAPDIKLDGEFQADTAIVKSIGESKAPGNPVAGIANVLVFPDLDSGNISYKLVERLAKAKAFGPITQGIAKPVNDLSRGCSAEDIIGVVAITACQCM